jgi:hypothetical protein
METKERGPLGHFVPAAHSTQSLLVLQMFRIRLYGLTNIPIPRTLSEIKIEIIEKYFKMVDKVLMLLYKNIIVNLEV